MNSGAALNLKTLTGWAAALLLTVSILCLADALAAGFKGQTWEFNALPGSSLAITAPLPPGAENVSQIVIVGNDQSVRVQPEELYSGFWLGGQMWRGNVLVDAAARPQTRSFTLEGPPLAKLPQGYKPPVYTVTVHPDEASLRQSSHSLLTRRTGLEPFSVSATLFALALPMAALCFLAARREERLLTLAGKAIVYMVKKTEDGGVLIGFSLGQDQGLTPGMPVTVVDSSGKLTCQATIEACMKADATARVVSGACALGQMVDLSLTREQPTPRP